MAAVGNGSSAHEFDRLGDKPLSRFAMGVVKLREGKGLARIDPEVFALILARAESLQALGYIGQET